MWSALMGVYERTEQDGVGPPVYKKQGAEHYLWCTNACGAGQWAVAGNKGLVRRNVAPLASCGTAVLPSEHGVQWQHFTRVNAELEGMGEGNIVKDLSITCTEVWGSDVFSEGGEGGTAEPADEPPSRLAASDLPPSIPSPTSPSGYCPYGPIRAK